MAEWIGNLFLTAGSGITLTKPDTAGHGGTTISANAGTGPSVWSSATAYVAGDLVIDSGGIWKALAPSTNSQPVSGNTNWTLVGGTPYTDLTVASVPATLVPDPGAGLMLMPGMIVMRADGNMTGIGSVTFTVALDTSNPLYMETPADDGDWKGAILGAGSAQVGFVQAVSPNMTGAWFQANADLVHKPLIFNASNWFGLCSALSITAGPGSAGYYTGQVLLDVAGGSPPITVTVATVGTAGELLTVTVNTFGTNDTYGVGEPISFTSQTQFAVTGVNQGTQTFTIAGNHTNAFPTGGVFAVAGSTGNDGQYTTVSATLNGGNTDIVTVEAIPNPTANGSLDPGGGTAGAQCDAVAATSVVSLRTYYQIVPVP